MCIRDSAMIILSTLFALLVANLTLIMVVQASYYQNMPCLLYTSR